MSKTTFTIGEDKKTLNMERVFNAPQDKLWKAFTTKELFEQWFAPEGWEVVSSKFEFIEGGENNYIMKCVDEAQGEWFGQTSAGKQVFSDIKPEYSLTYIDYFTDDNGVVSKDMPVSRTIARFMPNEDGGTIYRAETIYESEAALNQVLEMGMKEGYSQCLDKLESLVSNQ